jgi:hypothetical protein
MVPSMGVWAWLEEVLNRRRERCDERRRKMKEHRDALREFLRFVTEICSTARDLEEANGGPPTSVGQAATKSRVRQLEVASDQIRLTPRQRKVGCGSGSGRGRAGDDE